MGFVPFFGGGGVMGLRSAYEVKLQGTQTLKFFVQCFEYICFTNVKIIHILYQKHDKKSSKVSFYFICFFFFAR